MTRLRAALITALSVLSMAGTASAAADPSSASSEGASAAPVAPDTPLNEGWNATWALNFSFNNILVSGAFLSSPVTGSIGGTFVLSEHSAIRGGVTLGRSSAPAQVTKVSTTTGPDTVTTYTVTNPQGFTDSYNLNLRGEYLRRLMSTAIAPYIGIGGQVGWTWSQQKYLDDLSVVDQRTEIDNNTSSFDLSARALVGAEWRVHPNFAFYADYNVTLVLWSKSRLNNRTTISNTVGGVTSTSQTTNERDVNSFVTWSTGLSQGATLGLEIFF